MPSFSKNKKKFLIAILVLIIVGGFFVWQTRTAKGVTIGDIASSTLGPVWLIVNSILYLLFELSCKVVLLVSNLAQGALNQLITGDPVVAAGWNITRDLCNMFFALILLIMAFSTILQIETFDTRALLKRLIIAALLINFSLVFAGIIIDFSQILTNYFKSAIGPDVGLKIMNGLGVNKLFKISEGPWLSILTTSFSGSGGTVTMGLIMTNTILLITIFSLLAFAFFLIVRILWLWFLLIVSPFAWVSMIMPGGPMGGLWKQWWSKLFSWSFFAPIYMFFLYLGLRIAQNRNTVIASDVSSNQFMTDFFKISNVTRFVFVVATMLGGLVAAQKMGVYGANGAIKLGKSMVKGSGKLLGRWAARGAEVKGKEGKPLSQIWAGFRRGTSYLAPKPWADAWKARRLEKEKRAYPVATGARQDLLNRVLPWAFGRTDYRERAIRAREIEEQKTFEKADTAELIGYYNNARKANNTVRMAASLRSLAEQGNISKLFLDAKNPEYATDIEGFQKFADKELVPRFGEEHAYRLAHDLGKAAASTGDFMAAGAFEGKYNPQTKKVEYEKVPAEKAIAASAGFQPKGSLKEQIRTTKPTSYFKEQYDATTNKMMLIALSDAGLKRIQTLPSVQAAANLPKEIKMNLMVNFAGEVNRLNPELYSLLYREFKKMKNEQSNLYKTLFNSIKKIARPDSWENVVPLRDKGSQTFSRGGGI